MARKAATGGGRGTTRDVHGRVHIKGKAKSPVDVDAPGTAAVREGCAATVSAANPQVDDPVDLRFYGVNVPGPDDRHTVPEGVHAMFGAGEVASSDFTDPPWMFWRTAEIRHVAPDAELWSAQGTLRGTEHVDRYREQYTVGVPDATGLDADRDLWEWDDDEYDKERALPHVVRFHGRDWVVDGNHRLAAARCEDVTVPCRYVDLDARMRDAPKVEAPDPASFHDVAEHLLEGHISDNMLVSDDTYEADGEPDEYGDARTLEELREYHDWLHEQGVADHTH